MLPPMNLRTFLTTCACVVVFACGGRAPEASEPSKPNVDAPKACTQEAKMCPDGSAVSRTGPNCEFAPCPEGGAGPAPTEGTPAGGEGRMCTQDVKECPDGSFVARKPPSCAFDPCPAPSAGSPTKK